MKSRSLVYLVVLCLTLLLAAAIAARQQSQQPSDPELQQIEKTVREAWQKADQYVKAGGKESDANYPGRKWAATLWQYRQEHPGTPASTHATAEALHFLAHAELIDELIGKADSLAPDDGAWKRIIGVLREAAEKKKDYDYLITKSKFLLEKSPDREVKMRAQFAIAQGFWKKGETEKAKIRFQKVIADYPNTPLAREAEGNVHELNQANKLWDRRNSHRATEAQSRKRKEAFQTISFPLFLCVSVSLWHNKCPNVACSDLDSLNLGMTAPLFAYKGINGEPVALAGFKGKVVLLNFWASW